MSDYRVSDPAAARVDSALAADASDEQPSTARQRKTVLRADTDHAEGFLLNLYASQQERHLCDVEIEVRLPASGAQWLLLSWWELPRNPESLGERW